MNIKKLGDGDREIWYRKLFSFFITHKFSIVIIIGIFLRLKHYFENRSLWLDESWVALNVVGRSFIEILFDKEIMDGFYSPVIFSLIEKFSVSLLGNNEYALRLFPLLCGMGSLILLFYLLKRMVVPKVAFIALGLFAILEPLVYYSAELKQYSSDVFVALVLYYIFEKIREKNLNLKQIFWVGITGGLGLWISNTSVFILAGIGLTLTGRCVVKRQWKRLQAFMGIYLLWALSFVYLNKFLKSLINNEHQIEIWQGAFMPGPIWTLQSLIWLKDVCLAVFENPVGVAFPFFAAALFLIGCLAMYQRQRQWFCVLLSPILLALLAAILHKYPFQGRVLLFIVPAVVIFLSEGVHFITAKFNKISPAIEILLLGLLFIHPLITSVHYFRNGRVIDDNRGVLKYLEENFKTNDGVFFNSSGQFPFWYYAGNLAFSKKFPLENVDPGDGYIVKGTKIGKISDGIGYHEGGKYFVFRAEYNIYNRDGFFRGILLFEKLSKEYTIIEDDPVNFKGAPRTWVFFSRCKPELKRLVLNFFNKQGKILKKIEGKGASLYLYDLS